MSINSVRNQCPPTCPKVKEQLRNAIEETPWLLDGIFPQKDNDVHRRLPPDVMSRDIEEPKQIEAVYVHEAPVDQQIEMDVPSKAIENMIETRPIQERTIIPIEKITDRADEKIDLIEEKELIQKPAIIEEQIVIPTEKIRDGDDKKIDLVEEKELVQEPAVMEEQIVVIPTEKITDEKTYLVEEKELVQEPAIIEELTVIPTEKIADFDEEKIDLIEEKESIIEEPIKKIPVSIEESEIKDEIDRVAIKKIELESELEEYLEPEKPVEYDEEEESITDYEKFIDEELQEFLPAVIAKEVPEEPRVVRREISRNATIPYEKIDRKRPVRPPTEREAITAISEERPAKEEVTYDIPTEDACEKTCPFTKERKERIMRKLKERQQVVDHYYLTKGFSFEDVCTCSLACVMYTLSRNPFVKSVFASFALFAIGLKLCSELDAWEMPSGVS